MLGILLLLLVVIFFAFLIVGEFIRTSNLRRNYRKIPTPKGEHWLFGHGKQIKQIQKASSKEREAFMKSKSFEIQKGELDWSKIYTKWTEECGPIYHVRMINQILVIVSDPQIAKDLLIGGQNFYKTNHKYQRPLHNFSVFPFNQKLEPNEMETGNIFGASLQTSRGEQWRWRRKLMSPMFSNHWLLSNEILDYIQKESLHLCENIHHQIKNDNQIIQMDFHFHKIALRIICRFLFGNHNISDESVEILLGSLKELVEGFLNQNILFPNYFNVKYKTARSASQKIESIIQSQIDRLKNSENFEENSKCLLYYLLQDSRYSMDCIKTECTGLLFAGSDTISHAMSFTLGLLAQHKSQVDLIREEIKNVFSDQKQMPKDQLPSASLYSQLSHITSSLKESLRLYPIAWVVSVINNTPTSFRSFDIPALTPIVINLRAVNRNPDWYPEPDSFLPSRYLTTSTNDETDDKSSKQQSAELFSFSLGAHNCIGKFLAIYEARIILCELLKRFDFNFPDEHKLETRMYSTLQPTNGLPLRVTPIKK